ncbi:hypothetical protein GQ85_17725 [Rhodococcus rhodochrous]|nr:hypothetical protein GQ85_17725 [Rhodococcus rhodochrous]
MAAYEGTIDVEELPQFNVDGIADAAEDSLTAEDIARLPPSHPIVRCMVERAARIAAVPLLAEKVAQEKAAEIERERRNSPEAVAARLAASHERLVLAGLAKKRANHEADERFRLERAAADPAPPFDDGLLGDILARPPLPPDRIEGVMPWDASLLVIAQRKAGKTTLLLNIARSLLTGEPFLGQFATIPVEGRVAFLNYEVNAAQLARWAADTGIDPNRLYTVNLRGRRNPLAHPEDRAELARRMHAYGVESVIVDPFGRAYTGTSQNDAGEVTAFLVDLDQFVRAEVGARDLVLAVHAGWDGERTRGSSALEDWGDAFANLTADDKDQRYFRAKGRDVDIDEDMLEYDPATRRLTLAGTGGRKAQRNVAKVHELEAPITDVIRQNPGISVSQIRAELRKAKVPFQDADVSNALDALAARKRITRTVGGPGKPTTHQLRNDSGETNPYGNPGPTQPFATPSALANIN